MCFVQSRHVIIDYKPADSSPIMTGLTFVLARSKGTQAVGNPNRHGHQLVSRVLQRQATAVHFPHHLLRCRHLQIVPPAPVPPPPSLLHITTHSLSNVFISLFHFCSAADGACPSSTRSRSCTTHTTAFSSLCDTSARMQGNH